MLYTYVRQGREYRVVSIDDIRRWMEQGQPLVAAPLKPALRTLETGDAFVWEYRLVGAQIVEVLLPMSEKDIKKQARKEKLDPRAWCESWL